MKTSSALGIGVIIAACAGACFPIFARYSHLKSNSRTDLSDLDGEFENTPPELTQTQTFSRAASLATNAKDNGYAHVSPSFDTASFSGGDCGADCSC